MKILISVRFYNPVKIRKNLQIRKKPTIGWVLFFQRRISKIGPLRDLGMLLN